MQPAGMRREIKSQGRGVIDRNNKERWTTQKRGRRRFSPMNCLIDWLVLNALSAVFRPLNDSNSRNCITMLNCIFQDFNNRICMYKCRINNELQSWIYLMNEYKLRNSPLPYLGSSSFFSIIKTLMVLLI